MVPHNGVDYITHLMTTPESAPFSMGQPYVRVDLNPMPESTLSPLVRDFVFGLWPFLTKRV
jgi:hypothetical protein